MGHLVCHSFKARYYALPPIIGCADMPRGAAMPRLPLLPFGVNQAWSTEGAVNSDAKGNCAQSS